MTDDRGCPRCGIRVLAFVESADGTTCRPCGHRLSEGEYLALKEAFLAGETRGPDEDDDGFGFGGDWWEGGRG